MTYVFPEFTPPVVVTLIDDTIARHKRYQARTRTEIAVQRAELAVLEQLKWVFEHCEVSGTATADVGRVLSDEMRDHLREYHHDPS